MVYFQYTAQLTAEKGGGSGLKIGKTAHVASCSLTLMMWETEKWSLDSLIIQNCAVIPWAFCFYRKLWTDINTDTELEGTSLGRLNIRLLILAASLVKKYS